MELQKGMHRMALRKARKSTGQAVYEIRIVGSLDRRWTAAFSGLKASRVETPDGTVETRIRGVITDQAALRGILCKLWDLGLTLTRVEQLKNGNGERSN
jgi:hypothetical protein